MKAPFIIQTFDGKENVRLIYGWLHPKQDSLEERERKLKLRSMSDRNAREPQLNFAKDKCSEIAKLLHRDWIRKPSPKVIVMTRPSGMELNPIRYRGKQFEEFKQSLLRKYEIRIGHKAIQWNKKTRNRMIIELRIMKAKKLNLPIPKLTLKDCDDSMDEDYMSTEC